jgi:riboflavin synthase|tara:strand:+ start:9853 stop:10440 length:588 start_codon:yes stop_codon:yes gene_type:complete
MFTGIIEGQSILKKVTTIGSNKELVFESDFANEFKVDQSVSHNGVCLTIEEVVKNTYKVTAVNETLLKSNIGLLVEGDYVNIERSMLVNSRLDGHIVQGHVDQIGTCTSVEEMDGSFVINFTHELSNNMTVEKGSICINGISLTVFNSQDSSFSVAIIPYTWENTNLQYIKSGDSVNLEFDILGKYIAKMFLKNS